MTFDPSLSTTCDDDVIYLRLRHALASTRTLTYEHFDNNIHLSGNMQLHLHP